MALQEQKEILQDLAPELAGTEAGRLDRTLGYADAQTGSVFGDQRDHAVALLAAHMLTVAARRGRGGAVASIGEGDLSLSYGAAGPANHELGTTAYGVDLLRLRRAYCFGPRNRTV